jgi:hypothetical protein
MVDPEKSSPFYERRWFKGAVAVVGLATAVWALVGAPTPWHVAADLSKTKLPLSNTEIVLDASSSMAEPFGDGTKLEAAADAIGQYVTPLSNEGLALWRTGGGCGESGENLVHLGSDHSDDVQEAAAEQQPSGMSNMSYVVRAAIDDFSGEEFRGASPAERVLIFMGGEDECAEDASVEIRDELDRTGIDAVFRLIALKVSGRELKRLEDFKEELGRYANVEIRTPNTDAQLDEVMQEEKEAVANSSGVSDEEEVTSEEEAEEEEAESEHEEEAEEETTEEEEVAPEEEEAEEETTPEEEVAPEGETTEEEASGEEEASAEESSGTARLPNPVLTRFVEIHPVADLGPFVRRRATDGDRAVQSVTEG